MFVFNKKNVFIVAVVLLVGIIAWYFYGVHNNAGRIDDIGKKLDTIEKHQSDATKRLETIERGVKDAAGQIGESREVVTVIERRIETSQERLRTSEQIIKDSEGIIEGIRKRGE